MILNKFTMLQGIEALVSIVQESFIFLVIGVIGIFTEQLHLTNYQLTFRRTSSTQTPFKVKQTTHGRSYEDMNKHCSTVLVGVRSSCVVCCVCVKSLQDVIGSCVELVSTSFAAASRVFGKVCFSKKCRNINGWTSLKYKCIFAKAPNLV